MNLELTALVALVLAAIPAVLFLLNLLFYRRTAAVPASSPAETLSVLIPARNEEKNMRATLEAVLVNRSADFEIIVLDDHSTDQTATIVEAFARRDPRVRLESAPPLPPGWCGKQHACSVLARLARKPLLVFIDADVRLAPDALSRMAGFMTVRREVALASGVPQQALGTFSERLLLPLIHFVLQGYLPMAFMRWTKMAGFSAGCGQLFIARADAYHATGGHAMIRATLHDGVKLPRLFRRAGYRTDLFDATDLATCRMYQTNAETWRGLGKNATEGLGALGTILPMTTLLLGGQVLPFVLLALAAMLSPGALVCSGMAVTLACLPRLIAVRRFRQPLGSALMHPLGVLALLLIQWHALIRHLAGKPSEWKGRKYELRFADATADAEASKRRKTLRQAGTSVHLIAILAVMLLGCPTGEGEVFAQALPAKLPASIELHDQYDVAQKLSFPNTNFIVLTMADRKGSGEIDGWVRALKQRYEGRIELRGIADVGAVPGFLKGRIRRKFQEALVYPVMMDWSGKICAQLGQVPDVANILVLGRDGVVHGRFTGPAIGSTRQKVFELLDKALSAAVVVGANKSSLDVTGQARR